MKKQNISIIILVIILITNIYLLAFSLNTQNNILENKYYNIDRDILEQLETLRTNNNCDGAVFYRTKTTYSEANLWCIVKECNSKGFCKEDEYKTIYN